MNSTIKHENATTKMLRLLKDKEIVFYERKIHNGSILLLPYQLSAHKTKIQINITIDNKLNICRMGFVCQLNSSIEDIAEQLLAMNSELEHGNLSVKESSDQITYYLAFKLSDSFAYEDYVNYLYYCFYVFLKLYNLKYINTSLYSYKDDANE